MTADSPHLDVSAYYGTSHPRRQQGDRSRSPPGTAPTRPTSAEVESGAVSIDQLMRFEMDGMTGSGIFELLVGGDHYQRYPTWG